MFGNFSSSFSSFAVNEEFSSINFELVEYFRSGFKLRFVLEDSIENFVC